MRVVMMGVILICAHACFSEINYTSDESNFMGISVTEDDINLLVTSMGDIGYYCYRQTPSVPIKLSDDLVYYIWYYKIYFDGKTNIRLENPQPLPALQNSIIIGFRTDYIHIDYTYSFVLPGDPDYWRSLLSPEFPICARDEYFKSTMNLEKNQSGKYYVDITPPSIQNKIIFTWLQPLFQKYLDGNIVVSLLGEFYNAMPTGIMATAEPTLSVIESTEYRHVMTIVGWRWVRSGLLGLTRLPIYGTQLVSYTVRKLLIGWSVIKQNPPATYTSKFSETRIFNSIK